MNGFNLRVVGFHWVAAALLMTGLLMLAEHRPETYRSLSPLVLLAGLVGAAVGVARARGDDHEDIVTVATVVLANAFGVALIAGAMTEADGAGWRRTKRASASTLAGCADSNSGIQRPASAVRLRCPVGLTPGGTATPSR